MLADLELVEKRLERLKKEKGNPRERGGARCMLKAQLEAEKPLRELHASSDEDGRCSRATAS